MREEIIIQSAAGIGAVILAGIAVFQILLLFGAPWGEYSWGGKYRGVLPRVHRWMCLPAAILLILMAFVLLVHTDILAADLFPTGILVWVMTIFLGINTLGNAASRSRGERLVMTPLSGICLLSCLLAAIFE
ncbi:hypothetical protein A8990_11860 [Paenibacillus taihuensis]|uniref:Uncharacterized protein n=1 Tax=Paenibacillus taihuensis TaxID=1156355 RepID=A0A3D9RXZ7_9BACL|nr:hypothetical protein [Paenibacillus taihuensis]REE81535.1 hypothetical protein A8990_11860 [Paenibacillus taihuensis]